MSSARAILWVAGALVVMAAGACASLLPTPNPFRAPRDIRSGAAEMVIERVEQGVSREEVTEIVQNMVARETICLAWPTLWIEGDDQRDVFLVRFDRMARDWGAEVTAASTQRMQEFVDLGFLNRRERGDIGAGAVEFTLTNEGRRFMRGSPYGGERPAFCAPGQRRLVEIASLEWGAFACGSLRVRFTHVADAWPAWARTEGARAHIAESWAPIGVVADGTVSVSRQWFSRTQIPAGMARNGELRSLCYDPVRERITGDDLDLNAAPAP